MTRECGCKKVVTTSFYRLDKRRLSCILGNLARGTFCLNCKAEVMPSKHWIVIRLETSLLLVPGVYARMILLRGLIHLITYGRINSYRGRE